MEEKEDTPVDIIVLTTIARFMCMSEARERILVAVLQEVVRGLEGGMAAVQERHMARKDFTAEVEEEAATCASVARTSEIA